MRAKLIYKHIKHYSILISICMLFPYLTWAFDAGNFTPVQLPVLNISHAGKQLVIPEKLGSIQEGFQGNQKTVICIQDLHCNYEVQKNIARIIHLLAKEHGLKLVAEEGAFSSIDITPIRSFPVAQIREAVSDYFVKQGKLTGAEYYGATGEYPIQLEGLETPELYNKSLDAVRSFLGSESLGYLMDLRERFDDLKPGIYNPELLNLDKVRTDFREGRLDVLAYATQLKKYSDKYRADLEQYPDLKNYLNLHQQLFNSGVDPDRLFREMDALDRTLRASLYTTEFQREFDDYYHRLDIIEKLLNISATQEELQEFRNHRNEFTVKTIIDFVGNGLKPFPTNYEIDPAMYCLDQHLAKVEDFYSLADIRSQHFITNITRKMEAQQQDLAVIITGGFHADKIMAELKAKNIGYLSIRPCLTKQDVANPYFSILQGRKLPIEKLLAKNQTIMAPRVWMEAEDGYFTQTIGITCGVPAKVCLPGLAPDEQKDVMKWIEEKKIKIKSIEPLEFYQKTNTNLPKDCDAYVAEMPGVDVPVLVTKNGVQVASVETSISFRGLKAVGKIQTIFADWSKIEQIVKSLQTKPGSIITTISRVGKKLTALLWQRMISPLATTVTLLSIQGWQKIVELWKRLRFQPLPELLEVAETGERVRLWESWKPVYLAESEEAGKVAPESGKAVTSREKVPDTNAGTLPQFKDAFKQARTVFEQSNEENVDDDLEAIFQKLPEILSGLPSDYLQENRIKHSSVNVTIEKRLLNFGYYLQNLTAQPNIRDGYTNQGDIKLLINIQNPADSLVIISRQGKVRFYDLGTKKWSGTFSSPVNQTLGSRVLLGDLVVADFIDRVMTAALGDVATQENLMKNHPNRKPYNRSMGSQIVFQSERFRLPRASAYFWKDLSIDRINEKGSNSNRYIVLVDRVDDSKRLFFLATPTKIHIYDATGKISEIKRSSHRGKVDSIHLNTFLLENATGKQIWKKKFLGKLSEPSKKQSGEVEIGDNRYRGARFIFNNNEEFKVATPFKGVNNLTGWMPVARLLNENDNLLAEIYWIGENQFVFSEIGHLQDKSQPVYVLLGNYFYMPHVLLQMPVDIVKPEFKNHFGHPGDHYSGFRGAFLEKTKSDKEYIQVETAQIKIPVKVNGKWEERSVNFIVEKGSEWQTLAEQADQVDQVDQVAGTTAQKRPFSASGSLQTALLLVMPLFAFVGLGIMGLAFGVEPWSIAKVFQQTGAQFLLIGSAMGSAFFGMMALDADGRLDGFWDWLVRAGLFRAGPKNLIPAFDTALEADSQATEPCYTIGTKIYVKKVFMQSRPRWIQEFYLLHEQVHVWLNANNITAKHESSAYGMQAAPFLITMIAGIALSTGSALLGIGLAVISVFLLALVLTSPELWQRLRFQPLPELVELADTGERVWLWNPGYLAESEGDSTESGIAEQVSGTESQEWAQALEILHGLDLEKEQHRIAYCDIGRWWLDIPEVRKTIISFLDYGQPEQLAAIRALSPLVADPNVRRKMEALLEQNPEPDVHEAIIQALAPLLAHDPDLRKKIEDLLEQNISPTVCVAIIRALAPFLADDPDLPTKMGVLLEKIHAPYVRVAIIQALEPLLGDHPHLQPIVGNCLEESTHTIVKTAAIHALAPYLLNKEKLQKKIEKILSSADNLELCLAALRALQPYIRGNASRLAIVEDYIDNGTTHHELRDLAIQILTSLLDDLELRQRIENRLQDTHPPHVREAAVQVMAPLLADDPDLRREMSILLEHDHEPYVRVAIIQALAPFLADDDPNLRQQVAAFLDKEIDASNNPLVHIAAIQALAPLLAEIIRAYDKKWQTG